MNPSKTAQVMSILVKDGIVRSKDLREMGIHQEYLRLLSNQGQIVRSGRGIYTLPDRDLTENQSLIEASIRVPHGIICLLSALRFHNLTTQNPFEVWQAIAQDARPPKDDLIPLRIVYMSEKTRTSGIETHLIANIPVPIFNVPKTVADCFKYRNKIGHDVALEALRDCWRERRCTMDELWHYAKICRVTNVMRPYLESLTLI